MTELNHDKTKADQDEDEGYEIILDGNDSNSLQGRTMCGQGTFSLNKKDRVIVTEGGMGLLWHTKRKFRDFILRVDWKTSRREDNSGIFIRFPDPLNDPCNAVRQGYEIQIYNAEPAEGNPTHRTGAIYDFSPLSVKASASRESGQWNIFEIRAISHHYLVILNNEKVTEFTGNRQLEGYIGLQNHDAQSKVSFAKAAVKTL